MNKLNYILLLVSLILFGQNFAQTVFNEVYDEGVNEYNTTFDLIEYNSKYYSVGKTNYFPSGNNFSYILVNDEYGNKTLSDRFQVGVGKNEGISQILFKDNKFYIFGYYIDTMEHQNFGYNNYLYVKDVNFDSILLKKNSIGFYDYPTEALDYQDGFLVLGAIYNNLGIDSNLITLSYIDTLGNIINTKYFGTSGYDKAYDFKRTADGGFIIAGDTDDHPVNNDEQFFLLKVDSNLNQEWYYEYGDTVKFERVREFNYLEITEDGSFIFGGEEYYPQQGVVVEDWYNGRLLKIDSLGNLLWDKKININNGATFLCSIKQWQDESILIAGGFSFYSSSIAPFYTEARGYLQKLTPDGDSVIWQREFSKWWLSLDDPNGNGTSSQDYVHDMMLTGDGGILVSGYQHHPFPSRNDAWLIKFDSCGFTTGSQPQALLTVDSIIGATVYITNLSEEYCIASLDISTFDSLDIYAYSEFTNGEDPTQIQYTFADTGTYNLTLYTYAGDGVDTFTTQAVIKDTTTGIENVNSQLAVLDLNVFPNPAKDYFILQADFGMLNQVQHDGFNKLIGETYTITGQKVQEFNINPKLLQQRIYLNDLSNGVYVLKVSVGDREVGNERISVVK